MELIIKTASNHFFLNDISLNEVLQRYLLTIKIFLDYILMAMSAGLLVVFITNQPKNKKALISRTFLKSIIIRRYCKTALNVPAVIGTTTFVALKAVPVNVPTSVFVVAS
jgi:hypothetical protein